MAYPIVEPVATQYTQQSVTVAANVVTITIPAGQQPTAMPVINWIKASALSSGATPVFTLTVNGVVCAQRTMVQNVVDMIFDLEFGSGWPMWTAAGTDFAPAGQFTILLTGPATVSSACVTVGYSYVPVSSMRG